MGMRDVRRTPINEKVKVLKEYTETHVIAGETGDEWYWYPNHGGGAICNYRNGNPGMGMVHWEDNEYHAEYRKPKHVYNTFVGNYDNPKDALTAVDEFQKKESN